MVKYLDVNTVDDVNTSEQTVSRFSPDSTILVTGSTDGQVKLWKIVKNLLPLDDRPKPKEEKKSKKDKKKKIDKENKEEKNEEEEEEELIPMPQYRISVELLGSFLHEASPVKDISFHPTKSFV